MKTQIIALAPHDDLISVRDRMSWAKSPRILLVWSAFEQIAIRPLDLRILQQHAIELGANLALVTRSPSVKRDAEAFGIPVFVSAAEAQRQIWPVQTGKKRRGTSRPPHGRHDLLAMKEGLSPREATWSSLSLVRVILFAVAVLAVLAIASLFAPRATISLAPITMDQSALVMVNVNTSGPPGVLSGGIPAYLQEVSVSGDQTIGVQSRAEIPTKEATGVVQFENPGQAPLVIARGTVVYSVSPQHVRFVTLEEGRLSEKKGSTAQVPIQALDAGEIGNLPANAIQSIEGSLGAAATVTNPAPTSGGLSSLEAVPSQVDRDQLRGLLMKELQAKAAGQAQGVIKAGDVLLPATLELQSVDKETFDPPLGQPAGVLSLHMSVTYSFQYVRAMDLQQFAQASLDATLPSGYEPKEGTQFYSTLADSQTAGSGGQILSLRVQRTIMRRIVVNDVVAMARGTTRQHAEEAIGRAVPLASPPQIELSPGWWPWLPLIPFRISVMVP